MAWLAAVIKYKGHEGDPAWPQPHSVSGVVRLAAVIKYESDTSLQQHSVPARRTVAHYAMLAAVIKCKCDPALN